MDTFRSYLTQTNQSLSAFARRIGRSHSYVSEIASGKRKPSLRVAHEIWVASGGVIPMHYWLDPDGRLASEGSSSSHRATPKSTYKISEEING